jgi:hypothetical protein
MARDLGRHPFRPLLPLEDIEHGLRIKGPPAALLPPELDVLLCKSSVISRVEVLEEISLSECY